MAMDTWTPTLVALEIYVVNSGQLGSTMVQSITMVSH